MAYKTFSKEEIKVIGYDLLDRSLHMNAGYNDQYMAGISRAINTILSKFEEEVNTECSK